MTRDEWTAIYRVVNHRWSGFEFYDVYALKCDRTQCTKCRAMGACEVCPVCNSHILPTGGGYWCNCGTLLWIWLNNGMHHNYVGVFAVLHPLFKTLEEDDDAI